MTNQEWWALVDEHWDALFDCVEAFHPTTRDPSYCNDFEITAPTPERACENVRDAIREECREGMSIGMRLKRAKADRDLASLMKLMNEAWFGAPESRDVYGVDGFRLLCHLCEEPPEDPPDGLLLEDGGKMKQQRNEKGQDLR